MEEVIGFFFGFWLFIFSERFRIQFINEWKEGNWFNKLLALIFEIIPSILIGIVLPLYLILF